MDFMTEINVGPFISTASIRFAQEKLDGYYIEIYRGNPEISVYMKSRKVNIWPKLAQIEEISRQITELPFNTAIKAELWAKEIPATSITTLINTADRRLIVSPFEMPLYGGVDSSGWSIEQVNDKLAGFVLPKVIRLVLADEPARMLKEEEIAEWLNSAKESRLEGWVLKDSHCGEYWKLKPEKTVDAFVSGFTISESSMFKGGIKSLQVSVFKDGRAVIIADVGSGFDKSVRMANPKELMGKVIEVKYQDLAARGKLKFPVFIRFRDDEKSAKQCTYEQLAA